MNRLQAWPESNFFQWSYYRSTVQHKQLLYKNFLHKVYATQDAILELFACFLLEKADSIADEVGIHEEIWSADEQKSGKDETEHKVYDQNYLISIRIADFLYSFLYLLLD